MKIKQYLYYLVWIIWVANGIFSLALVFRRGHFLLSILALVFGQFFFFASLISLPSLVLLLILLALTYICSLNNKNKFSNNKNYLRAVITYPTLLTYIIVAIFIYSNSTCGIECHADPIPEDAVFYGLVFSWIFYTPIFSIFFALLIKKLSRRK